MPKSQSAMRNKWRMGPAVLGALLLPAASCSLGAGGVPAESMSPTEHRNEAREHEQEASSHRGLFEPTARASSPLPIGLAVVPNINADSNTLGRSEVGYSMHQYNPTARHLDHAAEHQRHASDHYLAAQALEDFTHAQCRRLDPAARTRCPLVAAVVAVEDISGGVRLRLGPGVSMGVTIDHMRCHHAFATQRHFEGNSRCPLYLRKLQIAPGADGRSVVVRSNSPDVLAVLRQRSTASVSRPRTEAVPAAMPSAGQK